MKHIASVSKWQHVHLPATAGTVCGIYRPTGQTKCVDDNSAKADKLSGVSIP